ncbi:MAG TPA: signal recognition particle-docking protein FtsY [Candidatus Nanoarchaeia archaeon]|nr:signal recognition particle-docking protein FtsY [Candidatus Nanoarchaeia archaeon]
MFSFLKEKIKAAVSKISEKIERKKEEEVKPGQAKEEEKKPEAPKEAEKIRQKPEEKPVEEKKGFFGAIKEKITSTSISDKEFEEVFYDLEMVLLENNVAVEVIDRIKGDLSVALVNRTVRRGDVGHTILETLKKTISDVLSVGSIDFLEKVKSKKPFVICFVGINGSGKTTTIAKIAHLLQKNSLSSVIAASDTFRAAAIDQLDYHAKKLGVKLIKHDYGADPAAVAFDAVQHAKAKNIDVVLIDTAGRLHSNVNLVDEMKKIVRVAKPDLKIFVGESITGNDCIEQVKTFDSAIGLDCIILSKADVDEKGGTALSIGHVTKKPILYLGVGQGYDDLKEFSPDMIMKGLGF